jgi:regulator of RNase E activity RraA
MFPFLPQFPRRMSSTTSNSLISKLSQFSTCELSDALIKLGSPHGGLLPDIRRMNTYKDKPNKRLCGPAFTVKMVSASDKGASKLGGHFVDMIESGSVVVVDAPAR